MESRFPCLQTRFGARNTWNHVRAPRKAREVPERAVFLTTLPVFREGGDSLESCLAGGGDYRRVVDARGYGSTRRQPTTICNATASPQEPLDLNKMTKQQLIEKIAAQTELKKSEAEVAVDSVLAVIAEALQANERVDLRGFGSFVVKERKERQGRNPRT